MPGRLSPPLRTTSIGHFRTTTTVPTRRVRQLFGRIRFDVRGCVDFIRGSSDGTDLAAEDYSVVAAALRICWDNHQMLSFGGALLQPWRIEGGLVRPFLDVEAVINHTNLKNIS